MGAELVRHLKSKRVRRGAAQSYLCERALEGEVITGLFYVQTDGHDMHHSLRTVERPLRELEFDELCPGADELDRLQAQYR